MLDLGLSISVHVIVTPKMAVWNLVPLCLLWMLWWECNQRMFEDIESSESRLLNLLLLHSLNGIGCGVSHPVPLLHLL